MILTEDNQELLRKILGGFVAEPEIVTVDPNEDSSDWLAVPSRFRIIEAADFASDDHIEPDWVVDELIPARGIGMGWGASGSYKTTGLYDVMTAVHRGTPWRDKVVKRGRCVLVVAEGEHAFPLRMKAQATHLGIPVADLPAVVPSAINLMDGKQVAEFVVELKKRGVAFVLFDTLQQCSVGADENAVKDQSQIVANLKFISRECQCFAAAIHHAGKNEERGARGSSVWRPAVDVELHYEFDGTRGTVTVEKLKDGPRGAVYPFESKVIELGISRRTGKPFGSVVAIQIDSNGTTAPTRATRKRPNKGNTLIVLQVLEKEFVACAPTLEEAFEKCFSKMTGKDDRKQEYFDKAIEALADVEKNKWLWRHDGDRIALTSSMPTTPNEVF
jgi:hypothetical protein